MSRSTIPAVLLPRHVCIFKFEFTLFFPHLNQKRYLKRGHKFSSLPTQFSDLAERIVLVDSHRNSYITKGMSLSIDSTLQPTIVDAT